MASVKQTPEPNHLQDGLGWRPERQVETPSMVQSTHPIRRSGPGRKPRACGGCKQQKMKCEVGPGDQSCKNCLRRGVSCVFKSVVMANDASNELNFRSSLGYEIKIDKMREEIRQMKQSLDSLLKQGATISGPALVVESPDASHDMTTPNGTILSCREDNTHMAMTRENSLEPGAGGEITAPGSVTVEEPMGSLYEITRLRNIRSSRAKMTRPAVDGPGEVNDFISRGVISEGEAADLYRSFHTTLNHYLWVGLEQTHPSFASVRKSSELLTATILTVTALHIPTSGETFDKCYKEFLSLISSSMFSRYHSIDDVRALVIAAFWLSEVSWKLSGHAIRIATELNIHQSFCKALEGDREHFQRARLWYMLYVCDHHFSIAYGRPPMIAESLQIREHELFLRSPFADAIDKRILSQVALMQILTRMYDRFAERKLPHQDPAGAVLGEGDFVDLRNFNLEIDQWRMTWHVRQERNSYIGSFPPKGIILYSYFAKLQLNSLAVRGVSLSQGRLSTERKEFANMAISAAASILTFVLEEDDMRRALVGTPLYVHTMIAFACVFLMKVATKWNRIIGLNVESHYVSHLLERMIVLLKSSVTSDRHLLYHIAFGLEKMLAKTWASSKNKSSHEQQGSAASGISPGQDSVVSFGHMGYGAGPKLENGVGQSQDAGGLLGGADGSGIGWSDQYAVAPNDDGGPLQADDTTVMNDNFIYEAFGNEPANDVYNLLTSHFSY